MRAMYVVFLYLILVAQERLLCKLTAAERDQYCQEARATAGQAFGVPAAPGSALNLRPTGRCWTFPSSLADRGR